MLKLLILIFLIFVGKSKQQDEYVGDDDDDDDVDGNEDEDGTRESNVTTTAPLEPTEEEVTEQTPPEPTEESEVPAQTPPEPTEESEVPAQTPPKPTEAPEVPTPAPPKPIEGGETGQMNSHGAKFVDTGMNKVNCKLHSDCYPYMAPNEWMCNFKTEINRWTDTGCYCDESLGCIHEWYKNNVLEYTNCMLATQRKPTC